MPENQTPTPINIKHTKDETRRESNKKRYVSFNPCNRVRAGLIRDVGTVENLGRKARRSETYAQIRG
jgi:hypothetical protein